jgi:hypothetical protein
MFNNRILSLCDVTGIWSQPYVDAGYDVDRIDIKNGEDVRLLKFNGRYHGIICQPPCTHFAASGARWWHDKGDDALLEGLEVVSACLRMILISQPDFWVLENPVGRLVDYIGPYQMTFDPCDYAGWLDDSYADAYTKKTCLWGKFNAPQKSQCIPYKAQKCTNYLQAKIGQHLGV